MKRLLREWFVVAFWILVMLYVLFSISVPAHAQDKPLPTKATEVEYELLPMPRPLKGAEPACHIVEYLVQEELDAKTGLIKNVLRYRVEPFARYDNPKQSWQLPLEDAPFFKKQRPGAIFDSESSGTAVDVCLRWSQEVRKNQKVGKK